MLLLRIIAIAALLPVHAMTHRHLQQQPIGKYDPAKDLLQVNWDMLWDIDDCHCIGAVRMLLDYYGIDATVVAGTGGPGNQGGFAPFGNELQAMDLAFPLGQCDGDVWLDCAGTTSQVGWVNADADWNHQSDAPLVAQMGDLWRRTLQGGGDVWIAEGGMADFTLHVALWLQQNAPELDLKKIHTVQHSWWNIKETGNGVYDQLNSLVDTIRIDDGNGKLNSNNGGDKAAFVVKVASGIYADLWDKIWEGDGGWAKKIDFSDTIEILWILEQIDFVDDYDSSKKPWENYVDIYNRFEPVDGSSGTNPICYVCGCPTCTVGDPAASFVVPPEYQGIGLESITCGQLETAGRSKLIPADVCDNGIAAIVQSTCGCQGPPSPPPPLPPGFCSKQDFLGECTTTGRCQNMYSTAFDCKNSEGGVCFCGDDEVCGCLGSNSLPTATPPPPPPSPTSSLEEAFIEKDGLVVMEMESVPLGDEWKFETSANGYTGTGYYRFDGNTVQLGPPTGTMTYKMLITNPGTYRLALRSYKTDVDSTWANDCYTRLVDHPGYQGGTIKTFMSGPSFQWSWHTQHENHESKPVPYYTFKTPGEYALEISGRSKNFHIDRVVLFDESRVSTNQAQNTSLQESQRQSNEASPPPPPPPSVPRAPTPTNAPVTPPTRAPVIPPTNAPVPPPTGAPVIPPTVAPVSPETKAPVILPTDAPVTPQTNAPILPPTDAPVIPPTDSPVSPLTDALVMPSTATPVAPSTAAPIPLSSDPPVNPPTETPITQSTQTPTTQSTEAPVVTSSENGTDVPATEPSANPISSPVETPRTTQAPATLAPTKDPSVGVPNATNATATHQQGSQAPTLAPSTGTVASSPAPSTMSVSEATTVPTSVVEHESRNSSKVKKETKVALSVVGGAALLLTLVGLVVFCLKTELLGSSPQHTTKA